jgi:hypothetical protein
LPKIALVYMPAFLSSREPKHTVINKRSLKFESSTNVAFENNDDNILVKWKYYLNAKKERLVTELRSRQSKLREGRFKNIVVTGKIVGKSCRGKTQQKILVLKNLAERIAGEQ